MKASEFCYWLQGYFEISERKNGLSPKQTETIQRHLSLVFAHELDKQNDEGSPEVADALQKLHDGLITQLPPDETIYRC